MYVSLKLVWHANVVTLQRDLNNICVAIRGGKKTWKPKMNRLIDGNVKSGDTARALSKGSSRIGNGKLRAVSQIEKLKRLLFV